MSNLPKSLLAWWRWVVGVGLVLTLLLVAGPAEVVVTLKQVSAAWTAVVALASLAWILLGAFNVWLLIDCLAPLRFLTFVPVYITSWATALLLPGQLGDATQVLLLRRHDIPMSCSGAAYVADKVISLSWLVMVAIYGATRYAPQLRPWWFLSFVVIAMAGAALGVHLVRTLSVAGSGVLARALASLDRVSGRLLSFKHRPARLAVNVSLTVVKWLLTTLIYFGCFSAVGSPIHFEAAATIPVMSSLVAYIPITAGGIGTMEWSAVLLFKRVGVAAASVISAYLLMRIVLLLVPLLLLLGFRSREHKGA